MVTTNGTTTLLDGTYTFTATETGPECLGNLDRQRQHTAETETANVDSLSSPGIQVQVFTSLAVTSTPAASAKVGQAYTYTVQTNAPSGDTVTVTPRHAAQPACSSTRRRNTFTWTPTQRPGEYVAGVLRDGFRLPGQHGLDRSARHFGRSSGWRPSQIPVNVSLGGNVTVSFSGARSWFTTTSPRRFSATPRSSRPTPSRSIAPAGQANSVLVLLPTSASAPLPQEVLVEGASGSTNNQVTVVGTGGANTFTLAGGTVTANGLADADDQRAEAHAGRRRRQRLLHAQFQHHAHRGRRYGRLQHAGLQPGHGGRERQSGPRQGAGAVDRPLEHHAFDLRRDQQADRLGTTPTSSPAARRRRRRLSRAAATTRSPAAAATTSSSAAAATTRSPAARART